MNKFFLKIAAGISIITAIVMINSCVVPETAADTRKFWVNDLDESETWTKIEATLTYQTSKANVWIRTADKSLMSKSLLKEYGDYFTSESFPIVTDMVYKPTRYFGEDGNRINILFYYSESNSAGYFWSKDFYNDEDTFANWDGTRSNETNIFYININSAVSASNQTYATAFTKGTLTHEFQHMCQSHYFTFDESAGESCDSWANEMCSVLIESVFADQADIYIDSYNADSNDNFKNGNNQILDWGDGFDQYTAISLFGMYLYSNIDSDKRDNLIKTLLTYSGDSHSSVHDLIVALGDEDVGYFTPQITEITDNTQVNERWCVLLQDIITGITGNNDNFNSFLTDLSAGPIATVYNTTLGVNNLDPSAYIISKTNVADINSISISDADLYADASVYQVLYHSGMPAWISGAITMPEAINSGSIQNILTSRPATVVPSQRVSFTFNRASGYKNRDFGITGRAAVTRADPSVFDGSINCFYVAR